MAYRCFAREENLCTAAVSVQALAGAGVEHQLDGAAVTDNLAGRLVV